MGAEEERGRKNKEVRRGKRGVDRMKEGMLNRVAEKTVKVMKEGMRKP